MRVLRLRAFFTRLTLTLSICFSGGFGKTIPYAREVAQYYLTLGVDHVYFSFVGDMIHTGSESVAYLHFLLNETRQLEEILEDFIADGKVGLVEYVLEFK